MNIFFKNYKKLMEAYARPDVIMASARKREILHKGQKAEDQFREYVVEKGLVALMASPEQDKKERWDFKLFEDKQHTRIAFADNPLNRKFPANLEGTVDVKTKDLTNVKKFYVPFKRAGWAQSLFRGVNWNTYRENGKYRFIHCPSFVNYLRNEYGIFMEHPQTYEPTMKSTDPYQEIFFTNNSRESSLANYILYSPRENGQDEIGAQVAINEIDDFSIFF